MATPHTLPAHNGLSLSTSPQCALTMDTVEFLEKDIQDMMPELKKVETEIGNMLPEFKKVETEINDVTQHITDVEEQQKSVQDRCDKG